MASSFYCASEAINRGDCYSTGRVCTQQEVAQYGTHARTSMGYFSNSIPFGLGEFT
jgi:hypothetical protein